MTTATATDAHPGILAEPGPQPDDGSDKALFDGNVYEDPALELKTKEGRRIDEIVLAFNGAITLSRFKADDVELYKKLAMGREVSFEITGKVVGDALMIKPATEHRGERLQGKRTVGVHTLEEYGDDPALEDDAA